MNLDMHSVTDIATEENFQNLNAENEQAGNEKYLQQVAEILSKCEYKDAQLGGAFIKIYHPISEGIEHENIAVKIVDVCGLNERGVHKKYEALEDSAVNSIINDKSSFLSLVHGNVSLKREDLVWEEKELVYLADEHRKYEQLYGEYVLPSLFVSFKLENDIKDVNGAVFRNKGEIVGVMVQDFEGKVRKIGESLYTGEQFTDWSTLKSTEVDNIEKFVNNMEEVYKTKGYYPDPEILSWGNLGLLDDGKVVLVDSNSLYRSLRKEDDALLIEPVFRKLRKQIAKYRGSEE